MESKMAAAGGSGLGAGSRGNQANGGGGGAGSPGLGPGCVPAPGTGCSPPASGPAAAAVVIFREPMYNWQAGKTTVKERFAFLFNNEILSDVHFLVGKGLGSQRIPAHRFVLAVGSAVFDAMFNGGMATSSAEIELPDVEPAAFLALLKFLYSDEVQIGPETVMTTLYTAKKYAVPALEAHCVEFLKKNLRADNAFMLLTQVRWNIHVVHDICLQKKLRKMARLFDEPQLASLCLENIDKNTSDAISAEGFTDIDLDTLMAVLERDTLGIREIRLFNAVVRWADAECQRQQLQLTPENKRKVLGKALSLIRFPLMTIEEFAAGPAQSGILTDREVVSLFLHFTVNPKPRVEFIDRPRCCLRGKECSINRFQQVESRWGYSGTSDRIRFTVNRRIFVVGFGLYGSIHGPTDYQVNIQIIHTDSNTILGQNDTGFSCDGSSNTFRVMFKEPVEILPNVNYTACATLKGPDSHYGTKGLRKVIHESPTTGTKTVFTFCYAAGNNNGTSVEDGQVPEIIFYT
ncbi:BTB/POZ domain-containing protein 2-like isoform X6 [Scyliorhinus canicula]|uniref:BTB/POZ domain-containing protein 2-like isoform X6 n=1 Tax=Scyliorhinus canicula TaxID=7830 RepID=UPI0018F41F0D|nr:BTB/POZ domain-containing protein 2-like isoform X6 [Scyliorhinus canicula]